MTFSLAEVFLLFWALVASGIGYYLYRENQTAKEMLFNFLQNEELRDHMVSQHKEIISRMDAQ